MALKLLNGDGPYAEAHDYVAPPEAGTHLAARAVTGEEAIGRSRPKGAHVAIEGELRSHECQQEVVVGGQRTATAASLGNPRRLRPHTRPRREAGINRRRRPGGAPLRSISSLDTEKSTHTRTGRSEWRHFRRRIWVYRVPQSGNDDFDAEEG